MDPLEQLERLRVRHRTSEPERGDGAAAHSPATGESRSRELQRTDGGARAFIATNAHPATMDGWRDGHDTADDTIGVRLIEVAGLSLTSQETRRRTHSAGTADDHTR